MSEPLRPSMPSSGSLSCGLIGPLGACGAPVALGAELNLCLRHHLVAYDWVARDVGVTDVLPSPCLACGSRLGVRYPSGWLCAVCEWKVGDLPDGIVASTRLDIVYYLRAGDRIGRGEWFVTNNELLAHIGLLRAGVDDPWNSYSLWVSQHLAAHG